jgi:simple sugar transport system substrate-binding protein
MDRRDFLTGAAVAGGVLAGLPALSALAAPVGQAPGANMYFRLCTHGGSDPFWAVVKQGMIDAAALYGCKAEIDLVGSDHAKLLNAFEQAVASKANGIALVINDDTTYNKAVEDALAAGVPVIGINNDHSKGAAGNKRLCYIGQNEQHAGYMLGLKLLSAGKDKGVDMAKAQVAMVAEDPTASYAMVRSAGVKDAMAGFGVTSFDMVDGGGIDATTNEQRETAYLLAHPDITFFMGAGGICTSVLANSLKNAGKKAGDVFAGGFDAAPGTVAGMKEDYVLASIDQQQYLQGYFAIAVLVLYNLYGLTPNIDTGGYLITKDNLGLIEKLSGKYR